MPYASVLFFLLEPQMKILAATGGLARTNGYMIIDEQAKVAVAIDAPQGTMAGLLENVKQSGATLELLLLTHGHWDHISDHKVATDAFPDAMVWISKIEEDRLKNPSGMTFQLPYEIPPRSADGIIKDGQIFKAGGIELLAIATPGHAAGHMCLYQASEGILFAGDLLMAGAVGRWDLADGDVEALKTSIHRVLQLPRETRVLSGHGLATTIGREKDTNPFLRTYGL